MEKLRVTILCDDAAGEKTASEHGFSMLFERAGSALLLDTGASGLFMQNARSLGRDLSAVRAVALSHNHYDHAGGLPEFLSEYGAAARVYISADFFKQCGWRKPDEAGLIKPTSGPLTAARLCEARADFRYVEADAFAVPEFEGAYILTNIPRTDFETPDETDLVCQNGRWTTDLYRDELALAFETENGLVVATGCAHTGACGIIECASARLGQRVAAVIGGTHLIAHGEQRAALTARRLKEDAIARFIACHCTGEIGFAALEGAGYERGFCGFTAEF